MLGDLFVPSVFWRKQRFDRFADGMEITFKNGVKNL